MVLRKVEKAMARFRCTRARGVAQPRDLDWKAAHIRGVDLRRIKFGPARLERIADDFLRVMSPSSMFVVPRRWRVSLRFRK